MKKNYLFSIFCLLSTLAFAQNNSGSSSTGGGITDSPLPVITPTLTTPTATSITPSTAILGATVSSSNGGGNILERGTVWSLSTPVLITDNKLAEGGSATTPPIVFSHLRSGFPAKTLIYYSGYAYNANGYGLSSVSSFYTLAVEPTTYPGSFAASSVTTSSLNLGWTAVGDADGYLILQKVGTAITGLPTDGTGYIAGATVGDATVLANVTPGSAISKAVTGLLSSTQYYFTIIPYTWDGSHALTYNYKTDGTPPSTNATTPDITYTWIGADAADWTVATNWNPTRTTPVAGDILLFNDGTTKTITNVPTQVVRQLTVTSNTIITLSTTTAAKTLTINGGSGDDFIVNAGSQFNLSGSIPINIVLNASVTGNISGSLNFAGSAHSFKASNAGSPSTNLVVFNSGASFTQGLLCTGNVFGSAAGQNNTIYFDNNSSFIQYAGSNPFGTSAPNSVVIFALNSNFGFHQNSAPSFSGRTYGNLELDVTPGSQSVTGASACIVNNLTITSGTVNFNLTAIGLTIKGNVSIAPGATLGFNPVSTTNLTFGGTGTQTISGSGTVNMAANSLLLINSTVVLARDLTVGGTLTINSGKSLTVNPGKALTVTGAITLNSADALVLKADATGVGMLLDNGTTTYNTGGTVRVERFIPANAIAYVSTPISNATRNVFAGALNLFEYDANTGAWSNGLAIDATPLDIMKGYVVKYTTDQTLVFSGTLNTGAQAAGTANHITLVNGGLYGWNLVGNPYAAPINMGSVSTPVTGWTWGTDIQANAAFRKNDGNVGYYTMAGSGTGVNGGTQYIPASQAFWINLDGSSSIGFGTTNATRVANTQNIYKLVNSDNVFRITANHNGHSDEAVIGFYPSASNGLDAYDIEKMLIDDPNFAMIYTELPTGQKLALNGLTSLLGNNDVPLSFRSLASGSFSLTANMANFDPTTAVSLEDTQLGITQNLRTTPQYSFTSNAVTTATRFILHFSSAHVEGTITYANTQHSPIANANTALLDTTGSVVATTTTDITGHYNFSKAAKGPMHISVQSAPTVGGWNAVDALLILNHFVGIQTLSGLRLAAADVNFDGAVNAKDAMYVQERFAAIINNFPASDYVTDKKTVTVNNPGDTVQLNVSALCRGDVNASFTP